MKKNKKQAKLKYETRLAIKTIANVIAVAEVLEIPEKEAWDNYFSEKDKLYTWESMIPAIEAMKEDIANGQNKDFNAFYDTIKRSVERKIL